MRPRRTSFRQQFRSLIGLAVDGRREPRSSADPFAEHWERTLGMMVRRNAATSGNRIEVFVDGDAYFERMWAEIESATRQVWVEIYVLEPDRVGRRTIEVLTDAARRGCETILFIDAFGSHTLRSAALEPLVEAGGSIFVFNPPRGRFLLHLSLLQRNHRKAIVIDGRVAYVGGMNVSEDYAGTRHGRGTFRDCQLRIEGPAACAIATSIARVLQGVVGADSPCPTPVTVDPDGSLRATSESAVEAMRDGAAPAAPELHEVTEPAEHAEHAKLAHTARNTDGSGASAHGAIVQVLESAGRTGRRDIQREMRVAFNAARRTLEITTPYFVPPRPLYQVLKAAARRGVEVRLLTAGRSDAPVVTLAARHIYDGLLRRGVRVFELHDTTLHAKTAVVDGIYALVGSFNLDGWSDKRNLELKVGIVDPPTTAVLGEEFEALIARSTEITLETQAARPWVARLVQWIAYHLMRI